MWVTAAGLAVVVAAAVAAGSAASEPADVALWWGQEGELRWGEPQAAPAGTVVMRGDERQLRAMLMELQRVRLEERQRIVERLRLEAAWRARVREVQEGDVAVIAAEHALEVLAAVDPGLAARVRARLQAAGEAGGPPSEFAGPQAGSDGAGKSPDAGGPPGQPGTPQKPPGGSKGGGGGAGPGKGGA